MLERFSERARQVVVLAQDEARALRHDYIGTEHLLLGLLREEEGIAARVLARFDLTIEEARVYVARVVGLGDTYPTVQVPFKPRAFRDPTEVEHATFARASSTSIPFALGWLLFAVAMGLGILVGWLIWG